MVFQTFFRVQLRGYDKEGKNKVCRKRWNLLLFDCFSSCRCCCCCYCCCCRRCCCCCSCCYICLCCCVFWHRLFLWGPVIFSFHCRYLLSTFVFAVYLFYCWICLCLMFSPCLFVLQVVDQWQIQNSFKSEWKRFNTPSTLFGGITCYDYHLFVSRKTNSPPPNLLARGIACLFPTPFFFLLSSPSPLFSPFFCPFTFLSSPYPPFYFTFFYFPVLSFPFHFFPILPFLSCPFPSIPFKYFTVLSLPFLSFPFFSHSFLFFYALRFQFLSLVILLFSSLQ